MKFDPRDVEFEAFSGKGPGGQHKNRHYCCIRATHIPTGIVAVATSERSLLQNKEAAIKTLAAKLAKIQEEKEQAAKRARRDEQPEASFGSQIRTYRTTGADQGVVDHRTGATATLAALSRGKLDGLIEAYMRWRRGKS